MAATCTMYRRWFEKAPNTLNFLDREKQVRVLFTDFGDSSINFKLLCWVDAIKQIYAVSDVMECIYDTLNAHGIEIPFPQRDVHLIQRWGVTLTSHLSP